MENLREAQLIMLDMLKVIDDICRDQNIKYWLDAGTLLGAIRHKGFIPWDDDLDIAMERSDYNKFIEIIKSYKNDRYQFKCKELDENYEHFYAKLTDKENYLVEYKGFENDGIFVDIYPFDFYDRETRFYDKVFAQLFSQKKLGMKIFKKYRSGNYNKLYDLIRLFRLAILQLMPLNLVYRWLYRKDATSKKYLGYNLNSGSSERFKTETIFPLKQQNFEDMACYTPNNSHDYLTTFYGSYFELPPEKYRISHAYKIILKKKTS